MITKQQILTTLFPNPLPPLSPGSQKWLDLFKLQAKKQRRKAYNKTYYKSHRKAISLKRKARRLTQDIQVNPTTGEVIP